MSSTCWILHPKCEQLTMKTERRRMSHRLIPLNYNREATCLGNRWIKVAYGSRNYSSIFFLDKLGASGKHLLLKMLFRI